MRGSRWDEPVNDFLFYQKHCYVLESRLIAFGLLGFLVLLWRLL